MAEGGRKFNPKEDNCGEGRGFGMGEVGRKKGGGERADAGGRVRFDKRWKVTGVRWRERAARYCGSFFVCVGRKAAVSDG